MTDNKQLVRIIRNNRYSHEICIPSTIVKKLKLKRHDILSCSLDSKGRIIYEKVNLAD